MDKFSFLCHGPLEAVFRAQLLNIWDECPAGCPLPPTNCDVHWMRTDLNTREIFFFQISQTKNKGGGLIYRYAGVKTLPTQEYLWRITHIFHALQCLWSNWWSHSSFLCFVFGFRLPAETFFILSLFEEICFFFIYFFKQGYHYIMHLFVTLIWNNPSLVSVIAPSCIGGRMRGGVGGGVVLRWGASHVPCNICQSGCGPAQLWLLHLSELLR